ncbi:MAG: hydantoinase B/oxoprolinase family protein [Candidatus Freyrarchaeum guaymaensis]|nr:hydantoinase B/oxoprolinase family protein [Candidatus Sigynarchaeota archaeon]
MSEKIDPYLMIILPRMFEAISREMTFTLLRSGRSGVINTARDFSSAIVTGDGRLFMIEEGLPVHLGTIHLSVQETLKLFDDLAPGDCILNNCPYTGNTHHADFTIMVPVFYEDELVFWAVNRAHQADVGAPIPTTYPFTASTIYEEGLHFPCVRVQRDYKDIKDIIRICRMRIRVPDQWYGDYLAQVGAARVGERRIVELCDRYGIDTLNAFVDEWLDYSERLMVEEIKSLPKVTIEHETKHDPPIMFPNGPYSLPGITPAVAEGIPLKVKITIDPDEARITVDLRDNIENQPFGFNLCYATTLTGAYTGIFNNLSPELPHNEGVLRRITVLVDEGKVAGIPRYPASTAVSTTNLCDRLVNLVSSAFAKLGPPWGMAEGNPGMPISAAVISGYDWRRPGTPGQINYINQIIITGGSAGGPAVDGHDGWVTYGIPVTAGVLYVDSVELDEQRFPIIFKEHGIVKDSAGAGKNDGAPSGILIYGPRKHPMTVAYVCDGIKFPPKGVLGGEPGHPMVAAKIDTEGKEIELLGMGVEIVQPGEFIKSVIAGGGGYGDPLERDPELVKIRVRDEWLSPEKARDVYGVVLKNVEDPERIEVDYEATKRMREELKKRR